jgi:hypothetical protein
METAMVETHTLLWRMEAYTNLILAEHQGPVTSPELKVHYYSHQNLKSSWEEAKRRAHWSTLVTAAAETLIWWKIRVVWYLATKDYRRISCFMGHWENLKNPFSISSSQNQFNGSCDWDSANKVKIAEDFQYLNCLVRSIGLVIHTKSLRPISLSMSWTNKKRRINYWDNL